MILQILTILLDSNIPGISNALLIFSYTLEVDLHKKLETCEQINIFNRPHNALIGKTLFEAIWCQLKCPWGYEVLHGKNSLKF